MYCFKNIIPVQTVPTLGRRYPKHSRIIHKQHCLPSVKARSGMYGEANARDLIR